jgi:hypothetical protein
VEEQLTAGLGEGQIAQLEGSKNLAILAGL